MKELNLENIEKAIEEIRMDNTNGSIKLAEKSADILTLLIKKTDSPNIIRNIAKTLIKAQPSMASIFSLGNNLMLNIDDNKNQNLKNIVQTYCNKFKTNLKISEKSIKKNAIEMIKKNSIIITHSYSSTVLNTLLYAKKTGKIFSVICTESRPMNEGIQLAKHLGKKGIKVKLIIDSAIFSFIDKADIIFLGGDAVTTNNLINKIGTKGIACYAKIHNIPTFALCSTIKFLPEKYNVKTNHQENPNEILIDQISNITPINYYFDLTPLDYLSGIITENNVLKPIDIKEKIEKIKIHNCFMKK